jgi:polar amino acid transport system substrate-binding protein
MGRVLGTVTVILGSALSIISSVQVQAACTPALSHPPLARSGYLISAINPTVAPVQYIDDSGNIVGLDPEFGDAIAERLCLKQELHSFHSVRDNDPTR